ncbi:unnamed protein product [Caretta caretta]
MTSVFLHYCQALTQTQVRFLLPSRIKEMYLKPQDMKVAEVLFDCWGRANAIEEVNLAYENVKEVDVA